MAGAHDSSHHLAGNDDGTTLTALRADFPAFRIWREITTGRTRYIARRLHPGPGPHTVVTHDLAELRAALGSEGGQAPAGFDLTRPNVARIYNYILGGKDNHLADRQAADSILTDFPEVAQVARANRDFVTRAVHYVATRHVTQFIDVGAGLPAEPAVHQAAQRVNPACRVAYVDNDPLVLVYARALLAAGPGVVVVPGDMREPEGILNHSDLRLLIDLDQPVCVLLASVLHFLLPSEADAAVAAVRAAMAPGSYLILSAGTSTGTSPALLDKLRSAYAGTSDITSRPAEDIAAWLTGLDLVPPGLVDVASWQPGSPRRWLTPPTARIIGAVGRKPGRPTASTRPPLPRRKPARKAS